MFHGGRHVNSLSSMSLKQLLFLEEYTAFCHMFASTVFTVRFFLSKPFESQTIKTYIKTLVRSTELPECCPSESNTVLVNINICMH